MVPSVRRGAGAPGPATASSFARLHVSLACASRHAAWLLAPSASQHQSGTCCVNSYSSNGGRPPGARPRCAPQAPWSASEASCAFRASCAMFSCQLVQIKPASNLMVGGLSHPTCNTRVYLLLRLSDSESLESLLPELLLLELLLDECEEEAERLVSPGSLSSRSAATEQHLGQKHLCTVSNHSCTAQMREAARFHMLLTMFRYRLLACSCHAHRSLFTRLRCRRIGRLPVGRATGLSCSSLVPDRSPVLQDWGRALSLIRWLRRWLRSFLVPNRHPWLLSLLRPCRSLQLLLSSCRLCRHMRVRDCGCWTRRASSHILVLGSRLLRW